MNIAPINNVGFVGSFNYKKPTKVLNRTLLQHCESNLKQLQGPREKEKAKNWVAGFTLANTSAAAFTAQAPGLDEFVLSSVEVLMATHIFNNIYDFKFSKTVLKNLAAGVAGHAVGKSAFKMASKVLTPIPILGNTLNAVIAGTTTAALGAALIEMAEEMDNARTRGSKLDDFIKKLGG